MIIDVSSNDHPDTRPIIWAVPTADPHSVGEVYSNLSVLTPSAG